MPDWTETNQTIDGPSDIAPDAVTLEEAQESEYTWRLLVWGEPGLGKTHFAYTAPKPLAYIDTEGKAEAIADKFDFGENEFMLWQPDGYGEAKTALDQALSFLDWWKDEEGRLGTIVVDSMSVLWPWAQQKYVDDYYSSDQSAEEVNFSSGFGGGKSDWKVIKRYHNKEFRQVMLETDYHVVWTAMSEEDYSAKMEKDLDHTPDKPAGEKENRYKCTDILKLEERDGRTAGFLQKSGRTKFRYRGLGYPTFDKHREVVEELANMETRDVPAEEYDGDYDFDIINADQ